MNGQILKVSLGYTNLNKNCYLQQLMYCINLVKINIFIVVAIKIQVITFLYTEYKYFRGG
jgi:hypothetical protein